MTNYLISVYQPDGPVPEEVDLNRIMADVEALNQDIRAAGGWVFGDGLHDPNTATVLRAEGGSVVTIDGPYLEGKEHLGGLTIVRAEDLDVVLDWARRLTLATGLPIEVRPFRSASD